MRIRIGLIFMSLVVLLSVCTVALADPGSSPAQFCKANDDIGVSHDTCVVCVTQGLLDGTATSTCSCKVLEDVGALGELGFDNVGQCISAGFQLF